MSNLRLNRKFVIAMIVVSIAFTISTIVIIAVFWNNLIDIKFKLPAPIDSFKDASITIGDWSVVVST